jgi:N-methylhydantoinase A
VGPVALDYVNELETGLRKDGITCPLHLMRSGGSVAPPHALKNLAQMLLSGLAGGVIARVELAGTIGTPNDIAFHMGGTSADFSVIGDGEPRLVRERNIDGQPLRLPTLDIETISSGGGLLPGWIAVMLGKPARNRRVPSPALPASAMAVKPKP